MPTEHDSAGTPNGNEPYMTIREMVSEIRSDVKELKVEAVRLAALPPITSDHETRIRGLERWKYGIPITAFGVIVNAVFIYLVGAPTA